MEKKKAIVIARTATSCQEARLKLKSQISWAKKKAKEIDVEIEYIISALGISGHSFLDKYKEQILDVMRQQRVNYLFVYSFDRLTRNLSQGTDFLYKITKLGCTIVTSSQIIDKKSILIFPDIEGAVDIYNIKKVR